MKKVLHIISHSHWDREWYMSFEEHHMRLIELIDSIIDKMENDNRYHYFHLDGQMIVIEDYLAVRPEMRERLFKLIREDRIQVGPWYVLQDEYLTSGEANIRNMTEGLKICKENGFEPVMTGYMPDAFGNISQMPQILAGFGIDNAVFGRGIDPVFPDNKTDEAQCVSPKEIIWGGADGTEIIGIMFTDWYNNANELPTDEEKVIKTYGKLISTTSAKSVTDHLLGMNGCDHQPLQKDLPKSIEIARRIYGDAVEIRHGNFKEYISEMRKYKDRFTGINGELCGQNTSGIGLLVNTASTHIPLKQKNHFAQNLLTELSEPVSVMSEMLGDCYRTDMLRYAWKILMQCHPHDSICCCSCDAVTREMSVRFDKSAEVADYVLSEAKRFVAEHIDTSSKGENNIVVFHTNPAHAHTVIKTEIGLSGYTAPEKIGIEDNSGNLIPSEIKYLGEQFTYTLPKDKFRQTEYKHMYDVSFPAELDGMGYFTYQVVNSEEKVKTELNVWENGAENDKIKMTVLPDGTLSITEKKSGKTYSGLNDFEDTGDAGDSYNYIQSSDGVTVYCENNPKIKYTHNSFSATFEITRVMDIPLGITEGKRSLKTAQHKIVTRATLNANSDRVDIETEIDNVSENHRLRALFPSHIKTDKAFADGQFDVTERDIVPKSGWKNPSNTQRMQAFFGLEDENGGLLIASRGLCEYEVLRDGSNTMALTLLRSVGEMGDWGVFPTPDLQLKRNIRVNYSVIPYSADEKASAFASAYGFAGDFTETVQTGKHGGTAPANNRLLSVSGEYIVFSTLKKAENGNGNIFRVYNVSPDEQTFELKLNGSLFKNAAETELSEKTDTRLEVRNGALSVKIPSKKIKTFRIF